MTIEDTLDRLTKAIEQLSEAIAKREVPGVNKVEAPKKGKAVKAVPEESKEANEIPEVISSPEPGPVPPIEDEGTSHDPRIYSIEEFTLFLQQGLDSAATKHKGDRDLATRDIKNIMGNRKKVDIPNSEYGQIIESIQKYMQDSKKG